MESTAQTPSLTGSGASRTSREPNGKDHCVGCALGSSRQDPYLDPSGELEWLEESAKEGCRNCAGFHSNLTRLQQDRVNLVRSFTDENFQSNLKGFHPGYELFIEKDKVAGRKQNSWVPEHPLVREMRKPSGDTSSTAAFGTLARWISRCQAEHPLCRSAIETSLPHRVLEIQSLRPLRVRMVENSLLRARYACLSHRWGPETKAKSLRTHNIELYKTEVPEDSLYPLVRNAIEAAFRLSLHYIWIDSYCILQDKPSDWEKEAANMGSIYENAFLTISATSSENGSSMFSTVAPESLGTKVTEVNGTPVFIRRRHEHPCNLTPPGEERLSGVTLDRAWVFQERLLSKRFIHFTTHEIFWECQQSTWCECESASLDWARQRQTTPRSLQGQPWNDIAREYDKTMLTHDNDRLPALAGVARRYAEMHGRTYLAGLWVEDLPSALLWFKSFKLESEPRPLHQVAPTWSWISLPRVAPTWSWISIPRALDLHRSRCPAKSVHIVGIDRRSPRTDIYTGGNHTEITVEGPVLDMSIYIRNHSKGDLIGKVDNVLLYLYADFDMDPEDSTRYQSVSDGTSAVLLLCIDDQWEESESSLVGILLLPSREFDTQMTKFERVGYLLKNTIHLHFDTTGEFTSYCGGRFPPFGPFPDMSTCPPREAMEWFMQRAEKRQLTIV